MGITHAKVSEKSDGADATLVRPSDWNAGHVIALADGDIPSTIARDTEVATAVSDHAGAADPHTGYVLEAATPGGELGGTYASPTVDSVHSGSAHHTQSHDHSAAGDGQELKPNLVDLVSSFSTALAGDTEDLATGQVSRVKLSITPSNDVNLSGMEGALVDGRIVLFENDDATHDIVLLSQSSLSIAANRFQTPNNESFIVPFKGSVLLEYAASRWNVVSDGAASHEALADPHTGYVLEAATPGGELGGTYASPTVDASHSGSTHAATQAAAEATAASALTTHAGAADPHSGYRLESADHSHASTGLQGGTISHAVLTSVTTDQHHAQAHRVGDHPAYTCTRSTLADQYTKITSGSFTGQFQDYTCVLLVLGGLRDPNNSTMNVVVSLNIGTSDAPTATITMQNLLDVGLETFRDGDIVVVWTSISGFNISWELYLRFVTANLDAVVQPLVERYNGPGATWYSDQSLSLSLPAGTTVSGTVWDIKSHEATSDPHTGYVLEAATPGGELGGTYASPTVDTTHSGSSHAGVVSTHEAAADPHTGYVLETSRLALTPAIGTAINSVTDITVASKAVTGIVAGDQVYVDAWFNILNNSGVGRTYVVTLDIGTTFDAELSTISVATSASGRQSFHFMGVFTIVSTSSAYLTVHGVQNGVENASGGDIGLTTSVPAEGMTWATSGSNLTGSQTVVLKIRSSSATATQTVDVLGFKLERVSP